MVLAVCSRTYTGCIVIGCILRQSGMWKLRQAMQRSGDQSARRQVLSSQMLQMQRCVWIRCHSPSCRILVVVFRRAAYGEMLQQVYTALNFMDLSFCFSKLYQILLYFGKPFKPFPL